MQIPGTAVLLQLCRESAQLVHHPLVAEALANSNPEKILEHLRQQRVWLGTLSPFERERLDVRRNLSLLHAKAASTLLTTYERLIATA